ncbi:MAG: hypothetical protein ABI397_02905 [Candidatus Saccharimonas sp.]
MGGRTGSTGSVGQNVVEHRSSAEAHEAIATEEHAAELAQLTAYIKGLNSGKLAMLDAISKWLAEIGYLHLGPAPRLITDSFSWTWCRVYIEGTLYELKVDDDGWSICRSIGPTREGGYKINDPVPGAPMGQTLLKDISEKAIDDGIDVFLANHSSIDPPIFDF